MTRTTLLRISSVVFLFLLFTNGATPAGAQLEARAASDQLVIELEALKGELSTEGAGAGLREQIESLVDEVRKLSWELEVGAPDDQVRMTYQEIRAHRRELIERASHLKAEDVGLAANDLTTVKALLRGLSSYFEAR